MTHILHDTHFVCLHTPIPDTTTRCGDTRAIKTAMFEPRLDELTALFEQAPRNVGQIYVGNFIEHLAYRILGDATEIRPFLLQCL
eukprot:m.108958 g.108958  ORF g.108958 m.108958 type:complete len:85 (-) comp10681_c3_seq1:46-300(-)